MSLLQRQAAHNGKMFRGESGVAHSGGKPVPILPWWWNGLRSGLRSRPRKGCEFESRPGHHHSSYQLTLLYNRI